MYTEYEIDTRRSGALGGGLGGIVGESAISSGRNDQRSGGKEYSQTFAEGSVKLAGVAVRLLMRKNDLCFCRRCGSWGRGNVRETFCLSNLPGMLSKRISDVCHHLPPKVYRFRVKHFIQVLQTNHATNGKHFPLERCANGCATSVGRYICLSHKFLSFEAKTLEKPENVLIWFLKTIRASVVWSSHAHTSGLWKLVWFIINCAVFEIILKYFFVSKKVEKHSEHKSKRNQKHVYNCRLKWPKFIQLVLNLEANTIHWASFVLHIFIFLYGHLPTLSDLDCFLIFYFLFLHIFILSSSYFAWRWLFSIFMFCCL